MWFLLNHVFQLIISKNLFGVSHTSCQHSIFTTVLALSSLFFMCKLKYIYVAAEDTFMSHKSSFFFWTSLAWTCVKYVPKAVHSVALGRRVTSRVWTCVEYVPKAAHSVALWTGVTSQVWTCVKYVPEAVHSVALWTWVTSQEPHKFPYVWFWLFEFLHV